MSRFDDRDQAVEQGAALREAEHDAPGLEIGGPAAVAQAAELMDMPDREAPAAGITARPAVQPRQLPQTQTAEQAPSQTPVLDAPQPAVALAPDGSGGGGTQARQGGAAQVHAPGPSAAVDASMQLRASAALAQHALLDEPAARTPVALRTRKKKKSKEAATPTVEQSEAPQG